MAVRNIEEFWNTQTANSFLRDEIDFVIVKHGRLHYILRKRTWDYHPHDSNYNKKIAIEK